MRNSGSSSSAAATIGDGPCSAAAIAASWWISQSTCTASRQSVVYLYPENVSEYRQHLCANGIDIPDLEETFYGMTEFRLDDPDGNRLWIGQATNSAA